MCEGFACSATDRYDSERNQMSLCHFWLVIDTLGPPSSQRWVLVAAAPELFEPDGDQASFSAHAAVTLRMLPNFVKGQWMTAVGFSSGRQGGLHFPGNRRVQESPIILLFPAHKPTPAEDQLHGGGQQYKFHAPLNADSRLGQAHR